MYLIKKSDVNVRAWKTFSHAFSLSRTSEARFGFELRIGHYYLAVDIMPQFICWGCDKLILRKDAVIIGDCWYCAECAKNEDALLKEQARMNDF